jgi:hypothetical protein
MEKNTMGTSTKAKMESTAEARARVPGPPDAPDDAAPEHSRELAAFPLDNDLQVGVY